MLHFKFEIFPLRYLQKADRRKFWPLYSIFSCSSPRSLTSMPTLRNKFLNSSSSSHDSLYLNPLMDKENIAPSHASAAVGCFVSSKGKKLPSITAKSQQRKITLKPSSLQLCIRLNEPESSLESSKPWDPLPFSSDIWDFSDTDAAPASSWSTLPNR